jgi:hypothetical protein
VDSQHVPKFIAVARLDRNNKPSFRLQLYLPFSPGAVFMYHHVKKLMFTVRVDEPDVRFGNMLLEQFGGANGELAAAMQYSIQGPQLRRPRSQGPFDGYRDRRA